MPIGNLNQTGAYDMGLSLQETKVKEIIIPSLRYVGAIHSQRTDKKYPLRDIL